MGPPAARRAGRRHHRQRREDEHQGSDRRRAGRHPPCHRQRAQLQQRAGSARHDPRRARRRRGAGGRDGHARLRRDRPPVRRRGADDRGGHVRGRRPHRAGRRDRRRGPRQARAGRGASADRARRSSTPTITVWRRWRSTRRRRCVTYGTRRRRPDRRRRARRPRPTVVPRRLTVGVAPTCGSPSAAPTWRRTLPPRWPSPGVVEGSIERAAAALASARVSAMRMEVRRSPSGAIIVNDAYNANPDSMRAALTALAGIDVAAEGGDPRPDGRARRCRGGPSPGGGDRTRARHRGDRHRHRPVRQSRRSTIRWRRSARSARATRCSSRRAGSPASKRSRRRCLHHRDEWSHFVPEAFELSLLVGDRPDVDTLHACLSRMRQLLGEQFGGPIGRRSRSMSSGRCTVGTTRSLIIRSASARSSVM